jgi:cell division septation protein DedD
VPATSGDVSLVPEAVPYPDRPNGALPPEPLGDPIAPRPKAGTPPSLPPPSPAKAPVPESASTASRGGRFEVQVMSLKGKTEADAVVRSLKGKGYSAFVSETNQGGRMYRVRVGGFADRRSADAVAQRLAKEENYNPWVDPAR